MAERVIPWIRAMTFCIEKKEKDWTTSLDSNTFENMITVGKISWKFQGKKRSSTFNGCFGSDNIPTPAVDHLVLDFINNNHLWTKSWKLWLLWEIRSDHSIFVWIIGDKKANYTKCKMSMTIQSLIKFIIYRKIFLLCAFSFPVVILLLLAVRKLNFLLVVSPKHIASKEMIQLSVFYFILQM